MPRKDNIYLTCFYITIRFNNVNTNAPVECFGPAIFYSSAFFLIKVKTVIFYMLIIGKFFSSPAEVIIHVDNNGSIDSTIGAP